MLSAFWGRKQVMLLLVFGVCYDVVVAISFAEQKKE